MPPSIWVNREDRSLLTEWRFMNASFVARMIKGPNQVSAFELGPLHLIARSAGQVV
jgi:hypothetical protein